MIGKEIGYKIHIKIAIVNLIIGDIMNKKKFDKFKFEYSLVNNLIASAKGSGMAIKLILLGPLRSWMYPKIFRSKRVKKAIATRIIKKFKIIKIIDIII